ncbi:PDF receptor [Schistosoma japonicum]|uniref:PDF receptor n=1 Tax=Schistosoma japonicum TaxID=6182 RepID=A0A4Z2DGP9_SCHJA|nr:PDF receptor [Schistosoma japonicum]
MAQSNCQEHSQVGNPLKSCMNFNECHGLHVHLNNSVEADNSEFMELTRLIWTGIGTVGSVITICSMLTAIFLYIVYPCLRNFRFKIHLQLFFALLLESIAQLILSYLLLSKIDQISLNNVGNETIHQTLSHQRQIISTSNTKSTYTIIQNTMIIIWELSQTCVFTWTFIEGIHIHELIVVSVFQSSVNMYPLMLAAWIVPIFITVLWLGTWLHVNKIDESWSVYTLHSTYWISNSFRLILLSMNMAFLINVIRVLVRRLQTNDAPEIQKLRKAVKAAVLLMPLLGITNFIVLLPEPNNSLGFFFISGIRRVLPTWQGFTISMIYYFMNKDVQRCIQMSIRKFKSKHQLKYPCFTLHFLPTSTIPTTNSV